MQKSKVNNYLLWIIVFFTFLGFYGVLLLGINAGMSGITRQLTIPMRLIIGISCMMLLISGRKNKGTYLGWFIAFGIAYTARIFIDYTKNEFFYIPYSELAFYFTSFVVIPFIGISRVDVSKINFRKLYQTFLFSALFFSSLSILLYGRFIGEVSRLSTSSAGESVISPLILSYCGALIIGVSSTYLIYNKDERKLVKILSLVAILMAVIPFFLGASRGGIFAIFFPFVLLASSNLSLKNILKYVILFTVIIACLIYFDEYMHTGLLDRFLGTTEAIETGGSSASRLDIWEKSFNQFIYNPFFGDRLNTVNINHYPHNIYLEVLQALGIVGFIPFIILIIKAMKASMYIFKSHPTYAWIPIFFLQAMMQNMFSGAIYTAAWFWTSMSLVLIVNHNFKSKYENY